MTLNNTSLLSVTLRWLLLLVAQSGSLFAQAQTPLATSTGGLKQIETIEGQTLETRKPDIQGTVLVFISNDCPIANSYQPLLEQLRQQWAAQKLQLIMIHGNPAVNIDQAKQHAKEFGIHWPIAIDPEQKLARSLLAKNIPEAFVLDSQARIVYRGRIDDQYSALGKKRPEPTSNDLAVAVENLLSGKPISVSETKAVGCVIRYANRF